jgi:SAM-dependent methyltransferase
MTSNQPERASVDSASTPDNVFEQQGMGERWRAAAAQRAQAFGAANDLLFELAQLQPGQHVLDVAAGTGDTSILAAERVGPSGRVLATDISNDMIAVAAEEAQKAGLANVETRTMDARSMDLPSDSFDAVISRMGIMLMPNREQALAEMRRVLKPGGRLAVMVWGTAERNLGGLLPDLVARRHAQLPPPPPDAPGRYALGAPGLLQRTLSEAGFRDVSVQSVPAPRRFASASAMMQFFTSGTPALQEPLAKLDDAGRAAVLAEIEETMRQFETPDGITIPGQVLVGAAVK